MWLLVMECLQGKLQLSKDCSIHAPGLITAIFGGKKQAKGGSRSAWFAVFLKHVRTAIIVWLCSAL